MKNGYRNIESLQIADEYHSLKIPDKSQNAISNRVMHI